MIVAIHQPHYFPWIGYFDKMAKADFFVLLDEVQYEKGSSMARNRILDNNGQIKYITISADTKNFLEREYKSIETKDNSKWINNQRNAIVNYYRRAEYKDEVMEILDTFFECNYETVCEWVCKSIIIIKDILNIDTKMLYQSNIEYDRINKKSDLVYAICNSLGVDTYLSGKGGSVHYLDREKFKKNNVSIVFQDFIHPKYRQCSSKNFVSGVSILDMLFNIGIDNTRELFWNGVKSRTYSKNG